MTRPSGTYTQAARGLRLFRRLKQMGCIRPARDGPELGVSQRTLQRDLAVVRQVLEETPETSLVNAGEPGGEAEYRLSGEVDRWSFSLWQILAVAVGVRMTGFLAGQRFAAQASPLLEQLRRSLKSGERQRLVSLERKIHTVAPGQKVYGGSEPGALTPRHGPFAALFEGLLRQLPVDLGYLSPRRQASGRAPRRLRVHPLSLVLYRGGAYTLVDVVGGDWKSTDRRILLAFDRVRSAKIPEGATGFEYPSDYDPAEHFSTAFGLLVGETVHTVRLQIDAAYAPYVRERAWHPSQRFLSEGSEDAESGDLILELEVSGLSELTDWILGMAEHVEVLEPPELRETVKRRLAAALGRYDDGVT